MHTTGEVLQGGSTITQYKSRVVGGPAGVACDDFAVNMVSDSVTTFRTR